MGWIGKQNTLHGFALVIVGGVRQVGMIGEASASARFAVGQFPNLQPRGMTFGPRRADEAGRPDDPVIGEPARHRSQTARVNSGRQFDGGANVIGRCGAVPVEHGRQQRPAATANVDFAASFQQGERVGLQPFAFGRATAARVALGLAVALHRPAPFTLRTEGQPWSIHSRIDGSGPADQGAELDGGRHPAGVRKAVDVPLRTAEHFGDGLHVEQLGRSVGRRKNSGHNGSSVMVSSVGEHHARPTPGVNHIQ